WGKVDEDGTASFGMSCTGTQLAAISDRLEGAARRARANGEGRTLGQLRAAIGTVLLLRGTVHLDDWPDGDDLITPEQTAQLAAILDGLPPAVLNVIVPLNHLNPDPDGSADPDCDGEQTGADAADEADGAGEPGDRHCTCAEATSSAAADPTHGRGADDHTQDSPTQAEDHSGSDAQGDSAPETGQPQDSAPETGQPGDSAPETGQPGDSAPRTDPLGDSASGQGSAPGAGEHGPDCACSLPGPGPQENSAPGARLVGPAAARFGSGVFGIGEVLGRRSTFLSPQEVARLALTPGSVMHRLVTDPLTGRCLERSTKSYPFTPVMKAQIAFADGMCRAPGCTQPAAACQFDHVTAHATGGHTCEAN
ncbi:hypothetical protein MWU75_19635, partial [Ornithinimicrobium sp. F0845]|nr:hypothetical protein [Ornithinimicrobium sp. F0845]